MDGVSVTFIPINSVPSEISAQKLRKTESLSPQPRVCLEVSGDPPTVVVAYGYRRDVVKIGGRFAFYIAPLFLLVAENAFFWSGDGYEQNEIYKQSLPLGSLGHFLAILLAENALSL